MTVTEVNSTTTSVPTINNAVENEKKSAKIEELTNEEDEITLEDLAPDGGWGWMIAFSMILIMFTMIGPVSSFTMIFGDFLEDSGQAGVATSLSQSVFMITFSIACLLTNTLLKRYSTRPVGTMGALLYVLPNISMAFVRNIYEMAIICFFQGFGMGLTITVTNTVFNSYFVKKRAKVMYASQVIIALGGIIYPILCEKMLPLYGFRGTAAIVGAIGLHSVVGMTMMHPVEWHAKTPEEVRAERAREKRQEVFRELAVSNRRSTIDMIHSSSKTKWSSLCSLDQERDTETLLPIEALKPSARVASVPAIESGIPIRESLSRRTSAISASSLVNLATSTTCILNNVQQLHPEKRNSERQIDKESQEKEEKKDKEIQKKEEKQGKEIQEKEEQQDKEIQEKEERQDKEISEKERKATKYKSILRDLVDMSLVKNWYFINLCFGVHFVCTADYAFSSFLPLIMVDAGYPKAYAALSITISGIAELASKILLSIFTLIINVRSKYIFFTATIFMGFAKISFLLFQRTLNGALITVALIGVVRSWLLVPQSLVIIEDLNIEKIASAYGINAVISTFITIIFGGLVGVIKDWTGSYKIYQISLLVLNGAFILPWALQFIFVDFRKWRKQRAQETNAKSVGYR